MEQQIVDSNPRECVGTTFQKYQSVEFSIQGLEYLHQFPIWNSEPASMFVLVKEDSEIVGRLKVGDEILAVVVAGDIRENVFPTLIKTVNRIKGDASKKKEILSKRKSK